MLSNKNACPGDILIDKYSGDLYVVIDNHPDKNEHWLSVVTVNEYSHIVISTTRVNGYITNGKI